MTLLLKSIKDPARLQWHEVKKVDHYYLSIDAVTQPMQVREKETLYGEREKNDLFDSWEVRSQRKIFTEVEPKHHA